MDELPDALKKYAKALNIQPGEGAEKALNQLFHEQNAVKRYVQICFDEQHAPHGSARIWSSVQAAYAFPTPSLRGQLLYELLSQRAVNTIGYGIGRNGKPASSDDIKAYLNVVALAKEEFVKPLRVVPLDEDSKEAEMELAGDDGESLTVGIAFERGRGVIEYTPELLLRKGHKPFGPPPAGAVSIDDKPPKPSPIESRLASFAKEMCACRSSRCATELDAEFRPWLDKQLKTDPRAVVGNDSRGDYHSCLAQAKLSAPFRDKLVPEGEGWWCFGASMTTNGVSVDVSDCYRGERECKEKAVVVGEKPGFRISKACNLATSAAALTFFQKKNQLLPKRFEQRPRWELRVKQSMADCEVARLAIQPEGLGATKISFCHHVD